MRIADAAAKDRVLDAAARLFYAEGIRAIGLQRVIEECGCGKNLLYTHFPSKDALVAAYLERMRETWDATLQRELALDDGDPKSQLIGVVRAVGRDIGTPGYCGCAFLNAAAEFPDAGHTVHALCTAHVTNIAAVLRKLATDAGLRDPQAVTDRLMLVINGLRASGAALGTPAVTTAISLGKDIVQSALPVGPHNGPHIPDSMSEHAPQLLWRLGSAVTVTSLRVAIRLGRWVGPQFVKDGREVIEALGGVESQACGQALPVFGRGRLPGSHSRERFADLLY